MKGIVIGKTNYDCLFTLIDMVKDKPGRHIFVVPDRMSVVCEKAIFERLNIESTCNIEVMTLSRIASRVLKNIQVITKTASVMILQKILNQNKQNLKCFNKTITSDLASNIFGTISQFKSCKVGFNDVSVKVDKSLLGDKIDDISLLYRCYQEELSKRGLMDSLDKLNFLEQEIKNSSYIRGASFYVAFFDGFTYQGYDIISAISNFAQNFYVGVTYSYGLNEHIYNKNYLDTMSKILKNAIVIQSSGVAYSKQFEFALDNLFTFSPAQLKIDSSNIDFYVGDNFEEELELSCMKIRQGIIKNECKTCDFNIAVPNLSDRKDIVANVFKKYDINYYLDLQNDFKDSAMMVYLGFAFDIVTENFSKNSILNFVKHNFFDMDVNALCDFEDYIIRYNITDKYDLQNTKVETSPLYENFCMVKGVLFDKIKDFYQSVERSKTYGDFVENTKKLIEKLHLSEIIDKKISEFIIDNNLEQARIYEQFMDSLNEILDTLRKILGDEECVFKDYISVLQGVEKSISTSPLSIDAVFIGDPSVSFFEKRKVLYIVGMSESDYPRQVQDCGLISDEDIRDLSIKYKLEPSIYEINRKERFRAYELLFVPTQKLVLSYNYKQEKSKIYEDLRNLFVLSKDDKNYVVWRSVDREDSPYADQRWRWCVFDIDPLEYTLTHYDLENIAQLNTFTCDPPYCDNSLDQMTLFRAFRNVEEFRQRFVTSFMDIVNNNFDPERVEKILEKYGKNLDWLDGFFRQRPAYAAAHLAEEFDLTGDLETVEITTRDPELGSVVVNTSEIDLSDGSWSGKYYEDYPITITAYPAQGCRFVGWKGDVEDGAESLTLSVDGGVSLEAVFQRE